MLLGKSSQRRNANRLLVLCTSINDVTAWPFWKFLQMKKIRGVKDMALLAFNSDGGSFEARIDGDKYSLRNYAKVKGYKQDMLVDFLTRWHDPGRSYFVYGGHGMGDYLDLEQGKLALQVHELARILGDRKFEAIVFDACFMANLDCAYHLRGNTKYIGACEGYMWEPDTDLDYHVFNTHNASMMSRYKDPLNVLQLMQKDYCDKAARGDFSILDTTHVEDLYRYVHDYVMPRVYERAALYNAPQLARVETLAHIALKQVEATYGYPDTETHGDALTTPNSRISSSLSSHSSLSSVGSSAFVSSQRSGRRQKILRAAQFEHSLYPSEWEDKHLMDLHSYLVDMAIEEQAKTCAAASFSTTLQPEALAQPEVFHERKSGGSGSKAAAGPGSRTRAFSVDEHSVLPPVKMIPSTPVFFADTPTREQVATGSPSQTSTYTAAEEPLTPFEKGSAHEGLLLFHKVVVSHRAPKAAGVYAARLGGLSITAHEYSATSKPLELKKVSKTAFNQRVREFIKHGSLAEVTMKVEEPMENMCVVTTKTDNCYSSTASSSSSPTLTATSSSISSVPLPLHSVSSGELLGCVGTNATDASTSSEGATLLPVFHMMQSGNNSQGLCLELKRARHA